MSQAEFENLNTWTKRILDEALALALKNLGKNHLVVANVHEELSTYFLNHPSRLNADLAEGTTVSTPVGLRQTSPISIPQREMVSSSAPARLSQGPNYHKALKHLSNAFVIRERVWGRNDPRLLDSTNDLIRTELTFGSVRKATSLMSQSVALTEVKFGPDSLQLASTLDLWGFELYTRRKYSDAKRYFGRSLDLRVRLQGENGPEVLWLFYLLGKISLQEKKYRESETFLRRSLSLAEKTTPTDEAMIRRVLVAYAELARKTGRESEAQQMETRAAELYKP